ncbi:MAG: hypothetical protein AAF658_18285, partial [Myxococcota bacterium]
VFLTADGDCQFAEGAEPDPLDVRQLLDPSDPLVSPESFNFPNDFAGTSFGSVAEILDASGACATPVQEQIFRLCFVASDVDAVASSDDPNAAVLLLIDTVAPNAPTELTITPGDGSILVDLDTDDRDINDWTLRFRPAESDNASCDAWPSFTDRGPFDAITQGEQDFDTSVDNGVTYEVCVFARDDAGNFGAVSETVTVTPRDECDFIECFPGGVNDGCTALPGLELGSALALLALMRRRKELAP